MLRPRRGGVSRQEKQCLLSGSDHGAGCGHVCGTLQSREAVGRGVLQCLGIYMP